ncbi:MAG: hypothetical protein QXL01_01540 [Thermoplasmatales archaeon]
MYPSEFKRNENTEIAEAILGDCGRMLSGSKGQYCADNSHQKITYEPLIGSLYFRAVETSPRNVVVFNANIVTSRGQKIWYGDVDLTLDEEKVKTLARILNDGIYVLRERHARFENESDPKLEEYVYYTNGEVSKFQDEEISRVNGRAEYLPLFNSNSESIIPHKYNEQDFAVVKLKFDDINEDDEEYEFYNELDTKLFFDGLSEEVSPLHKYQQFLFEKQGVRPNDYTAIYLTKEAADRLKKLFTIWYEVYHGEYESDYQKSSNINWMWFNNGPSSFTQNPEWVQEGKVYLRKRNG